MFHSGLDRRSKFLTETIGTSINPRARKLQMRAGTRGRCNEFTVFSAMWRDSAMHRCVSLYSVVHSFYK